MTKKILQGQKRKTNLKHFIIISNTHHGRGQRFLGLVGLHYGGDVFIVFRKFQRDDHLQQSNETKLISIVIPRYRQCTATAL